MAKDELTIRPAGPQDADQLAALWSIMAEQHHGYHADVWCWSDDAEHKWREHILKQVSDQDAVVLVAEAQAGQVLGFVHATVKQTPEIFKTRRRAEVWDLVVAPGQRSSGIGRKLMEAAMKELARRGAQDVMLHVALPNEGATRFYERLGFIRTTCRMYMKF